MFEFWGPGQFVDDKEFHIFDFPESEQPDFYEVGGISIMRDEDWLNGYEYYFPASQHREVEERELKHYGETTDVKALGRPSVAFYMPQQALLVADLCNGMTIQIRPSAFSDLENKHFDKLVESMQLMLKREKEFAQLHAWKLYRKLNILNVAIAAEVERGRFVARAYQKEKSLSGGVSWADYEDFFKAWDVRNKVEFVEGKLAELNVTPQEILQVLEWLETKAGWRDPIVNLRSQIKLLMPAREAEGEKSALFAFTCLDWMNKLCWACMGTGYSRDQDLKKKIDAIGSNEMCRACGTVLQRLKRRGRPNKDTCGKLDCVRYVTALKLRAGKASGRYKYPKNKEF